MAAALPPDTRIERTEGGLRLSLPPRPLGSQRMAGLFLLPFGAVFAGLPLGSAISAMDGGCFGYFFLVFSLPFAVVGTGLFFLGLWFLFPGRTRIVLDRKRLRTTERFGLIWWSRSVPRDKVRSFQVQRGGARDDGSLAITVEGRSSPFMIGQTYPSEWLEGVAQALGETHGGARIEEPAQAPPPPAPVAALKVVEVESAPAGTDIVLEYTADAVRLSIPRKGVWKAGGCMIGFGLFWSAISWTVFGAAIASREWGGVAFASLFVAVGTGILLGAVHSGIKTMQIELGGASLVVRKTGLFGKKVEQWLRSSLSGYSIEDSGWEVNDVKQWQIRIDRSDGKPIKLLRGRSTVELNWICSVLRNGPIGRVEAAPSEIKATGAECQVCNAPMTSDIVYCARCKTPHHGQCWQYLGQCSTYGCREIRYTTT